MRGGEAAGEADARTGSRDALSTRRSQLERLRNLDDKTVWAEFVGRYRGLVHGLAAKAGLGPDEAEDVVQDTLVAIARKMPGFVYQPERCSFQGWIRHVAACRIIDRIRRRKTDPCEGGAREEAMTEGTLLGALADEREAEAREAGWEEEWRRHVLAQAMDQLELRVKPEHFQIFRLVVLRDLPPAQVAKTVGVLVAQVYLVRHRLTRMLQEEVRRLCSEALPTP